MRVLVLTSMYPPRHLGGYELSCRDTMRRWVAAGHEVAVLASTYDGGDSAAPDDADIEVHRDIEWWWRDGEWPHISPPKRFAMERHNQRTLRGVLASWQPDVVSVWAMGGMSLSLLTTLAATPTPLVYVVYDEWLGYGPRVDAWTAAWRDRPRLAAFVRAVTGLPTAPPDLPRTGVFCFISHWLRQRATLATGSAFDGSHIVPAGIDPDDFPLLVPETGRPWHDRLLCVGRVEKRKGFQVAIEALPMLPAARLVIDGPAEGAHVDELRRLEATVGVTGRVDHVASPRRDLARQYAAADVLIFTAIWDEPFGLVPLEAMACGTPVIATGTGGSAEYLRHEDNCLLVPPGDVDALAAAVRRLAVDAALRDRIVHGGTQTAAQHSAADTAAQLEAIHLQAVAGPR